MSENALLNKIHKVVEDIDIKSEKDLIYLFVLLRKKMEELDQNVKQKFRRLRFYFEWPLHKVLDRDSAACSLSLPEFPDSLISLEEFRCELLNFCDRYFLHDLKYIVENNWQEIKDTYICSISDTVLRQSKSKSDGSLITEFILSISSQGNLKFITAEYDEC